MKLGLHVLFFVLVSFVIVVMGAFYSERDDAKAFRAVPRRFLVFLGACLAVSLVMLAVEYTFASVD